MIGLESVGIESGGYLDTDDGMRVGGHDWLFAIGDVNGRALLTHAGKYQAWVAARTILGDEPRPVAEEAGMPRVTFTDPQVAAAGLTLEAGPRAGVRRGRARHPDRRDPRGVVRRQGHRWHLPAGRGAGLGQGPRGDLHRLRDGGVDPRGDDRGRRRAPDGPAPSRRSPVPHPQRDLAAAAGGMGSPRTIARTGMTGQPLDY